MVAISGERGGFPAKDTKCEETPRAIRRYVPPARHTYGEE
jgi:hypothetical protein